MKKIIFTFAIAFTMATTINAQSAIIGAEPFTINLPAGFQRTIGTNDFASVQWGNEETETYGFVITENLDELKKGDISDNL